MDLTIEIIESTKYIALVSGLDLGSKGSFDIKTQLLTEYLSGELGGPDVSTKNPSLNIWLTIMDTIGSKTMLQYITIDHCRQFHRRSWACWRPRNYSKNMSTLVAGRCWFNLGIEKIWSGVYSIWLRAITSLGWAFRRTLWHHANWYHARWTWSRQSTITTTSYATITIPKIPCNEESSYGHKPILVQGGWCCVSTSKPWSASEC